MEKFIEQEVKGEQIQFDKDLRPYIAERPMGVIVECLQSKARNPKTRNLTLLEALTHCIKGAARLKENSYYAYYLSIRHIPLGHVHITKQSITIDFDGIGITPLKFIYENTMGAYIGNQDTQEILSEATTSFNGCVLRELLRTCKFLKVPQLTPPPPTANAKKKSAIKETPNTKSTLQTRYEQRLQEFYYQTGVIFDRNGTSFKQTFIMMDILLPMLIAMRDFAGVFCNEKIHSIATTITQCCNLTWSLYEHEFKAMKPAISRAGFAERRLSYSFLHVKQQRQVMLQYSALSFCKTQLDLKIYGV